MTHYPFELPPLPYAYDALEPYIDTLTMELHHDRHLKTYTDNLNAALKDHPEYHSWSLEKLITGANWLPEALRTPVKNNAGGVYNHVFFFSNLTPEQGLHPDEALLEAIDSAFGGFEEMTKAFATEAAAVFGSGYAWLAADAKGGLTIVKTANQDTLLTRGLFPVICIDVWEHAYYLKHYNKRAGYIQDWVHIVNWETANTYFKAAQAR
jgi:Fe-Mn family superoxide dismutase